MVREVICRCVAFDNPQGSMIHGQRDMISVRFDRTRRSGLTLQPRPSPSRFLDAMSTPSFKPPLTLLLIDIVGTVMAALGIAALLTDLSGLFPFLGDREVAGFVALVGCAMMSYGLGMMVKLILGRRNPPSGK
jgi:hypothetical protein